MFLYVKLFFSANIDEIGLTNLDDVEAAIEFEWGWTKEIIFFRQICSQDDAGGSFLWRDWGAIIETKTKRKSAKNYVGISSKIAARCLTVLTQPRTRHSSRPHQHWGLVCSRQCPGIVENLHRSWPGKSLNTQSWVIFFLYLNQTTPPRGNSIKEI